MAVPSIMELGSGMLLCKIDNADINATAGSKAHDIFGGPAKVLLLLALNYETSLRHVKLYDAVDPTEGTTDPDYCIPVAAASGSVPGIVGLPFGVNKATHAIEGHKFVNGVSAVGATTAGRTCTAAATALDLYILAVRE